MRGLDEVRSVADPVEETGSPSISKGVDKLRGDDLSRTEVIALPVTLITLLLVFSSLVRALVPLLLALSSIAAAIGLSIPASHVFPDAGVGTNVSSSAWSSASTARSSTSSANGRSGPGPAAGSARRPSSNSPRPRRDGPSYSPVSPSPSPAPRCSSRTT